MGKYRNIRTGQVFEPKNKYMDGVYAKNPQWELVIEEDELPMISSIKSTIHTIKVYVESIKQEMETLIGELDEVKGELEKTEGELDEVKGELEKTEENKQPEKTKTDSKSK
jgi:predicted nuclease with TOPRIM domain